jgi:hypothetical protein
VEDVALAGLPGALGPDRTDQVDAELAGDGPWYVRQLDDDFAMSLVAISTVPDTGAGERWPDFDHHEIVAATLIQQPRYVDIADERWDENAQFIADARQNVPRLIAEIRRLRQLLATKDQGAAET